MKKGIIIVIVILVLLIALIAGGVIFGNWSILIKTPSHSIIVNDKTKDLLKTTDQIDSALANKIAEDLIMARTLYTTRGDDLNYIREITGRNLSDEMTRIMIHAPEMYERNNPASYTKITKEMILNASTSWSSLTGWEQTPQEIVIILQNQQQIRAFEFNDTWFWS